MKLAGEVLYFFIKGLIMHPRENDPRRKNDR
jgi:hypothetical protein